MESARGRSAGGLVDDVAGALAAALRARPVASALALGASVAAVMFDPVSIAPGLELAWVVAAACLAGVALSDGAEAASARSVDASVLVELAIGLVVADLILAARGVDRSSARLAAAGVAFHVGSGTRNRPATVCALLLAAVTLTPSVWTSMFDARTAGGSPACYASWLGLIALLVAARRGGWGIVAPLTAAALAWQAFTSRPEWSAYVPQAARLVEAVQCVVRACATVIGSTVLAVIAGRSAATFARDPAGDPSGRLVARVQRAPWRVTFAVLLAGTGMFALCADAPSKGHMLVAVAGMACLAQCTAGSDWSLGSPAPWIAGLSLSIPFSLAFAVPRISYWARFTSSDALDLEVVVMLYIPLIVGLAFARTRTDRFPWWGWLTFAVVWAIGVANCDHRLAYAWRWIVSIPAWCVVVSLLFEAVATSQVSAWLVLAVSPIASFVVIDVFYGARLFPSACSEGLGGLAPAALVAGPVAALLALAARRVRSMTALPDDHPVLELASARPGFREG